MLEHLLGITSLLSGVVYVFVAFVIVLQPGRHHIDPGQLVEDRLRYRADLVEIKPPHVDELAGLLHGDLHGVVDEVADVRLHDLKVLDPSTFLLDLLVHVKQRDVIEHYQAGLLVKVVDFLELHLEVAELLVVLEIALRFPCIESHHDCIVIGFPEHLRQVRGARKVLSVVVSHQLLVVFNDWHLFEDLVVEDHGVQATFLDLQRFRYAEHFGRFFVDE